MFVMICCDDFGNGVGNDLGNDCGIDVGDNAIICLVIMLGMRLVRLFVISLVMIFGNSLQY